MDIRIEKYDKIDECKDMKMFWNRNIGFYNQCELQRDILYPLLKQDLGLFFWERGGKQFVDFVLTLKKLGAVPSKVNNVKIGWKELLAIAKDEINETKDERNADAQDFLDSVACFGETKVKELIKENGV